MSVCVLIQRRTSKSEQQQGKRLRIVVVMKYLSILNQTIHTIGAH
jgi:hypothetical protein